MQRIGILRGGIGDEYHLSLESGARIMQALHNEGYETVDMLVDREGVLHIKGIPTTVEDASKHVDMVWNALQGAIGEDGHIQELLDAAGVAYSGSTREAAALAHDKLRAKEKARELGIKTPEAILVMPEGGESISEITQNIYKKMAPPWVLKPLTGGSSVRTYFAFTPLELAQFVDESITHGQPFIVEQYIYGKEAAVGVIDSFRGQDKYVLPVVEIKKPTRGILTHHDRKLDDHAVVIGGLRSDEREKVSKLARDMHDAIGARDYSQSEFIIDKYGKVWYIETDTVPHMHERNAFVRALKHVGSSVEEFVKSVIGRK
jgi:D-alanine-D-alanine ligase